jgi:hypothetical protein
MTSAQALTVVPGEDFLAGVRIRLEVADLRSAQTFWLASHHVYNCTYSNLNEILDRSGLTRLYLRYEQTELALVRVPADLANLGITVMCGPFFSVMPFPPRGLHSLSHVSFTPHFRWSEVPSDRSRPRECVPPRRASQHERMLRDAARYVPCMAEASYIDSLWEVKTILPKSDSDDGRPILFKRDEKAPGLVSVLGGKVDNIYELDDALKACVGDGSAAARVAQARSRRATSAVAEGMGASSASGGPLSELPLRDKAEDLAW